MTAWEVCLIFVIVSFTTVRQILPRRVNRFSFVVLPLMAAYECLRTMPDAGLTENLVAELSLSMLGAFATGVWQTAKSCVYEQEGEWYVKGGVTYGVGWGSLILFRLGLKWLFEGTSGFYHFSSTEWILWAGVAVAWGVRSISLLVRYPDMAMAMGKNRVRRRAA